MGNDSCVGGFALKNFGYAELRRKKTEAFTMRYNSYIILPCTVEVHWAWDSQKFSDYNCVEMNYRTY